jgi:hypothetical protein
MAFSWWIAIGAGGSAAGAGIAWAIGAIPFIYLVYLQVKEKYCPQQEVFHHCSNCGIKIAFYKDPVNDSCCFGMIPAKLWRSKTVEEDNFPNQELIFQYEQAHDVADNMKNANTMMKADFKNDPNVMQR